MFCNFSFGPVGTDTPLDNEESENDILLSQLRALYKNSDYSLYPFPADGYQKHLNPETEKELPYCCNFHQEIFDEASTWYEIFPNCCSRHKEFALKDRFDKTKFSFIPKKIVLLLSQTEYFIAKEIDKPDWGTSITGYIDYNFICFKYYAIGLNIYLHNLEKFIHSHADLSGLTDNLKECLWRLERHDRNGCTVTLYPDFAPLSLYFEVTKQGRLVLNGGMIFHGRGNPFC